MKFLCYILFLISPLLGFTQTTTNLILNNSFEKVNSASSYYNINGPAGYSYISDTSFSNSSVTCWAASNVNNYNFLNIFNRDSIFLYGQTGYGVLPPAANGHIIVSILNWFSKLHIPQAPSYSAGFGPNVMAQTRLDTVLTAGVSYRLSGYFNTWAPTDTLLNFSGILNDNIYSLTPEIQTEYNKVGFYFSQNRITRNSNPQPFFNINPTVEYTVPHISHNNSPVNPWHHFDLSFTATGGEQYLSIGNFDSTCGNIYVYPDRLRFLQRSLSPTGLIGGSIVMYFDNLTLIPLSDTGMTVIDRPVGDPGHILPSSSLVCSDRPLTLATIDEFRSYSWSTGDTGPTTIITSTGIYTITVNNGCNVYTDTITILPDTTLRAIPQLADSTTCADVPVSYSLSPIFLADHIRWSSGDSTLTSSFTYGTHTVTVSNQCFTASDTFITAYTGSDTIRLFTDTVKTFCPGHTYTLAPDQPYPSYLWSSGAQSQAIPVTDSGYYSLTVTDTSGCRISDTIHYARPILPTALLTQDSIRKCASDYPITITAEAGFSQYYWNGVPGTSQYVISSPDVTVYASATTLCGTVSDTFAAYSIHDLTGIAYTIDSDCTQNTATISLSTIGSPSVLWSNGLSGDHVTVSLPQQLIVQALYTCTAIEDTIRLPGCAFFTHTLYIPNAFTPNGDGINDAFEIFGDKYNIKYLSVAIFDRWGEKVFESNDIGFRWDGRYKAAPLEGVYVYDIAVVYTDDKVSKAKGSITVTR
jgi:gliding motility-associated-like protein